MCLEGDYPHLSKPPTPPLLSKQLSVALPWLGLLLRLEKVGGRDLLLMLWF